MKYAIFLLALVPALSSCMTLEGLSTTKDMLDATSAGVSTTSDATTSSTPEKGEEKAWTYDK